MGVVGPPLKENCFTHVVCPSSIRHHLLHHFLFSDFGSQPEVCLPRDWLAAQSFPLSTWTGLIRKQLQCCKNKINSAPFYNKYSRMLAAREFLQKAKKEESEAAKQDVKGNPTTPSPKRMCSGMAKILNKMPGDLSLVKDSDHDVISVFCVYHVVPQCLV